MFTAVYVNGANIFLFEQHIYLRQNTRGKALEIVKKPPLTANRFHQIVSVDFISLGTNDPEQGGDS